MLITYHISIVAHTLDEAVQKFGFNGNIVGEPVVVLHGGAGTELKNLIARFGLKPGLNCKCGQHIREMDTKGIAWCVENVYTITEWLREEAERARLPFTKIGARILIRKAIKNARKKQKENQDMTVNLVVEIDDDDVYSALERTRPKEGKVKAARAEETKTTPPQPQARSAVAQPIHGTPQATA